TPAGTVRGEAEAPAEVVFAFTGQGSQAVGMGRDLYEHEPIFRAALDEVAALLDPHLTRPILSVIYPRAGDETLINQTTYTQPALFAIEYALAQLWMSWGILPAAVTGHSVGEYVAAVLAGVFSLADGAKLIAARARLMGALPTGGTMAACLTDETTVTAAIAPYAGKVAIGAINSPTETVISGEKEAVSAVIATLSAQKIRCVELTVSHAFHSPLMEPMLDAFYNVAVTIAYQLPNLPYASNLTGALASGEVATPDYWVQHVREAVRFADGARALYAANYRTFLEVGARPILSGLGKRIFNDPLVKWVPSLRPERDAWQQLGESLAALYIAGANIAWENVQRGYTVPLPSYPFQRQRYWYIEGGATLSANYQDPVTTDATGGVPTGDVVAEVALPGAVSREMLSAFEDAYNAETPIFNPNAADSEIWRRMTQADPNDRRVIMVEYLRGQVAGVLGMPVDQVGEKHRFFDLGMDSLMSVELKNRLEADLGHNLSLTLAFDYPNIGKLADYILNDVLAFANAPVVVATQEARPMIANEPIAVIGMACRLPGNSDSPEQFWDLLINGRDAVTAIPTDRWDADELYDANVHAAGKSYVRAGAFLNTPPDEFDPLFFGISPREAASIDPQHRLLLEMAWESLENAGQSPTELEGSTTGVYVGINTQDYLHLIHSAGLDAIDSAMTTGTTFSASAGRISYALGLEGPSMAIDTACSASLVGIHLAASALRNGECDLALAGGVSLMLSPVTTVGMSRLQALAPDGRCKTFDADADGYGRGEGAGMVVLKRLSDAQRDGDRVLALVRGSAVNQDGASGGLTVPNGPSQQTVIKAALKAAGLQPHDVDYVEAHGTGTSLGDPIEISALANALGRGRAPENPLLVGSAKTNIGHLESGAGIAGFIKLVLSLQHGVIPPHINMNKPSPNIEWDRLPIKITTEPTAWVATPNKPRIAGISSFGFTGTNAHVIVEEAPRMVIPAADVDRTHHVLALSARSEAALYDLAASYANLLANDPTINLGDLTYTANVGRAHFDYRLAVTTESASALEQALRAELSITKIPKTAPKLAWMFTGQGAQSVGMARELYMTSPTFRQALDQCASRLSEYLEQPLLGVIFNEDANNPLIHHTGYTQPALFAVEYALAQLWLSWGIRPDAVTGHSVGEVVAATVAGVFSLDDAIKLIAARGRLMGALPAGGTMAACITDEKTAAAAIAPFAGKVALAGLNSPTETVISGEKAAVQQAIAALKAQGIRCVELSVSHAFHSPLMEPMLAEFRAVVSEITFHAPQLPLVSNVTGQMADAAHITTPEYWVQHVREAVRFADGLRALHAYGIRAFLEVGPKPVLTNLAKRTLEDDSLLLATSLNPRVADWQALLDSVGMLYTAGFNVQWRGLDQDTPRRKITLPTYRFQRKPYWFTERNPQAAEDRRWRNMADWFYQIEWQPQPLP
ncbi:MAG: acyltransferase domain-containing protein, partial [Phototrophicaceae bacterium]